MGASLYFFISYPRTKKENPNDILFVESEGNNQKPKCIYINENYDNQIYYYKKIYKVNKLTGKNLNNYYFEFQIDDDKYVISFYSEGNSIFVYDVILEVVEKVKNIRRKINQTSIEYYEKMNCFIESLKRNGEKNKIDELYKETIELYSQKKGFSLLITLFLNIYKKKDLCSILLVKFKDMNKNLEDNKRNMDRDLYLKEYISEINTIKSEAEKLINYNNYNSIEFYGIILCYLNYYDYENFSSIIFELSTKRPNDLYEILIIYNAHFIISINQTLGFYNKFIKYIIFNKEFSIFKIGLSYIRDIETFINIIEKNKENIFIKYIISDNFQKNEKYIITIEKSLKFKKIGKTKENNDIFVKYEENQSKEGNKSTKHYKEEYISKIEKKNKNETILEFIKNIESIIDYSKKIKYF